MALWAMVTVFLAKLAMQKRRRSQQRQPLGDKREAELREQERSRGSKQTPCGMKGKVSNMVVCAARKARKRRGEGRCGGGEVRRAARPRSTALPCRALGAVARSSPSPRQQAEEAPC